MRLLSAASMLTFITITCLLLFYLIHSQLTLPIVYWSTSKNECVKVIIKGQDCDCSKLPEKYERIWVK